MNAIEDLSIEKEILPLFDFTVNHFAKEQLREFFRKPLNSVVSILERQDIIKGFMTNEAVFANYSYSKLDFYEVYEFLHRQDPTCHTNVFLLGIAFPKRDTGRVRSALIQLVTLFREIEVYYVKKLDTKSFPEVYKTELRKLYDFFTSFNLNYYEERIKEDVFEKKDQKALARIIAEKQKNGEMELFFKHFAVFEAYVSISKSVLKYGFCFPVFEERGLELKGGYHPLLINPVKNDFSGNNNVLLLTGPNMSGKSTFLKAIGICVYLAHVGMAVPATAVQTPFYNLITVSINHYDDIMNGYSHFMMEIVRLKEVVEKAIAGVRCFAIFDELFKGTNIEDAVEISKATLNGLARLKSSSFFISTHLHQLKDVKAVVEKNIDTCYVDCTVNNGIPVFTYQVKTGWSDLKIGQLLFAKEGLYDLLETTGD